MKIAVVTGTFPPLSESFVLNHVTGLIEDGHEVQVFSNGLPGGEVHPDFDSFEIAKRMFQPSIPKLRGRWVRLPASLLCMSPRRSSACLNVFRYGLGAFSLKALYAVEGIVEQHFDIIHCHFGQNGLAMLPVSGLAKIPLVTQFHGNDMRAFGRFGAVMYRRLFRLGDAFVVNSKYTGGCLEAMGCAPEKITEIPAILKGNATPRSCPIFASDAARLLTVARLDEGKGIQHGLRAVQHLAARGYRVHYTIIGNGSYRATLENLARELKVEHLVEFAGWKTQDEVFREYGHSDVFVFPSVLRRTGIAEPQGLVVQEAQLHGLPVVGSRIGGIPQGVNEGKAGLLFEPGNAADLADQVAKLIDDRAFAERIAAAGREYCLANYMKPALIARTVALYRSLAGERKAKGRAVVAR